MAALAVPHFHLTSHTKSTVPGIQTVLHSWRIIHKRNVHAAMLRTFGFYFRHNCISP